MISEEITTPEIGKLEIHENGFSLTKTESINIEGVTIEKKVTEIIYKINGKYYHQNSIVLNNTVVGNTNPIKLTKKAYKSITEDMFEWILRRSLIELNIR
ncbi:MAG: hypothetical protein B6229_04760 [Spirochaetaceae bacterium 4572_7]|nr:MAG: hypothetical protein B6229_04760 [Spirochaetaceae bacterium 4572_7]